MQVARNLTLVLSFVFLGAGGAFAQGLPAAEIQWPEGRAQVTIPFDYENGFVVIPVSVMGSKELRMILDTGSPLIVIPDVALAATMNLNIATEVQVGGSGDGKMQTAPAGAGR